MKVLLIIGMFFLVACEREHGQRQLSPDQLNLVAKMQTDYQQAKLYNDSLISAINGTLRNADPTTIRYFDEMYHQYDSEFEKCHGQYNHDMESADHSHNSQGMVVMHNSNGGMMGNCNCCANGGHKAEIHQKMTSLRDLHSQYYQ